MKFTDKQLNLLDERYVRGGDLKNAYMHVSHSSNGSPLHITGTWLRNNNGYITSSWDIKGVLLQVFSQGNNNSINVPSIDFAKGVVIESKAGYVYNYVCPEDGIIIRHWQTQYGVNYYSNYVKVNEGINLYYTDARLTINEFTHHLYYYVKKGDKITCFFTSPGNLTFYPIR